MSISILKMKLHKVDLNTKTLMEFCVEKVNAVSKKIRKNGIEHYYDNYIQAFKQELIEKYVIIDENVFEISDKNEEFHSSSIFTKFGETNKYSTTVNKNIDGTFDVYINHNNGSSFWTEHLEEKHFK